MRKPTKVLVSLFLAALMFLSVVPVMGLAADPTVEVDPNAGTTEAPDNDSAEEVDPCHKFLSWEETTPATCTEEGEETARCEGCGEIKTRPIAALGHNYGPFWKITVKPTCTEAGVSTRFCTRCGEAETKEIPVLDHVYGDKVVTEPTCVDKGYTTYVCDCGASYDDDYVDELGHTFGEWTMITEATCIKNGVEARCCKICAETEERDTAIIPTNHTKGDWEVTTPATSYTAGLEVQKCTGCGVVLDSQVIPALGKVNSVVIEEDAITLKYKKTATLVPVISVDEDVEYTVTYVSSDEEVVTVNENGEITTTGRGTATITCTVTDEYGNSVSDTCDVRVKVKFTQWLIIIFLFGWIWYI